VIYIQFYAVLSERQRNGNDLFTPRYYYLRLRLGQKRVNALAQLPSNLAAFQAAVPPSDAGADDSLPADLMALSLEALMGLRVRSRAEPDRDEAPRARVRPQETLAAAAPAVAGPGGAAAGPDGNGDLPADLTALSLAQLMNLPLRAPQPEPEEAPEAAEDDAEDGETVPEVAQTETDPGPDDDAAPPAAAGAAFAEPELDGDGAADPEDVLGRGESEGDDPLEGTTPPVGAVQLVALLDTHDDVGPGSAAAFVASGPAAAPGGGGDLNLTGGAGNDVLVGGAGDDSLRGLAGDDSLTGSGGIDTLIGDEGQDSLFGGAGDDILDGGNGKDLLDAGAGDDSLDGGNGKDSLLGGAGDDSLVWDKVDDVIDGGADQDTLLAGGGDITLTTYNGAITSIECVEMSGDGAGTRLTLDAQDLLDMSSSDILTVSGDAGDSVEAGTGWTDGGVVGVFHVYTQGLATLEVDLDVTVNADITF
jgi:hypothetical protein